LVLKKKNSLESDDWIGEKKIVWRVMIGLEGTFN